ncbi:MAG: methyltransferase, partial [Burkholderiaceae bacterium]
LLISSVFFFGNPSYSNDVQNKEILERVLQGSHRSEANRLRDKYRRPVETLTFFGVKPDSHVVEITPGRGWYSEILAPLLKKNGTFTAVIYDADLTDNAYLKKLNGFYKTKLGDSPKIYSNVQLEEINHKTPVFDLDSSADFVLTFRNVHNWAKSGTTDEMFRSFYKSLKTGGVLGVVEHRARAGTPLSQQIKSGYMTEQFVIKTAEKAGFVFKAGSDVNNNSLDAKDHKNGVWTLLPVQRGLSDKEKSVYAKIGESDRMTLKFVKP